MFKTLQKIVVLFSILCVFSPSAFSQFLDVPTNSPEYKAVKFLAEEKIIQVGENRLFKPNARVNRYEMSVLIYRTLRRISPKKVPAATYSTMRRFFKDVSSKNFAYDSIRRLYKAGILSRPYKGRFRGKQTVTRYEFYTAFAKTLKKTPDYQKLISGGTEQNIYIDVPSYHWAYKHILILVKAGFLPGDGLFEGESKITRKESALFLYKAISKLPVVKEVEVKKGKTITKKIPIYPDVPGGHYAKQDIAELLEAGILSQSPGERFRGNKAVNRYQTMDLLAKVIEKILVGEGQLRQASYQLKYKDVSVLQPAYPSIQKLIELGLLPSGNDEEVFYGWKRINRYQMAYIFFKPLEEVLSGTLKFEKANPSLMYKDVSPYNFAYPILQKLIWIGALEGGAQKKFKGDKFASRYEMVHFVSNLLKSIYYKIEDKEIVYAPPLPDYGFDFSLITSLSYLQKANGKTTGEDLTSASASQNASLAFDHQLGSNIKGYLNLRTSYSFGQQTGVFPSFYQGYVVLNVSPFIMQAGRQVYYETYDPFGNSLFVDTFSDMILVEGDSDYGSIAVSVAKLIYLQDLQQDSNAATLLLKPNIGFLPLELSLGGGAITDPLDPSGLTSSGQLPCRIYQYYVGSRMSILDNLVFNAEIASVSYTNEDNVLPYIGFSSETNKTAWQSALTYYSSDLSLQASVGYQKIGDDFYMAQLIDPTVRVGGGQGTSSWLVKIRNYLSRSEYIGLNLEHILYGETNITNKINLLYNNRLSRQTYLRANILRTEDKTAAEQSIWSASGSLSVYF